jgi:hypothetical protein
MVLSVMHVTDLMFPSKNESLMSKILSVVTHEYATFGLSSIIYLNSFV